MARDIIPRMITASMISSRVNARTRRFLGSAGCRVAHASRVLTLAARQRGLFERLFRRDAETNTRDACATRQPVLPSEIEQRLEPVNIKCYRFRLIRSAARPLRR